MKPRTYALVIALLLVVILLLLLRDKAPEPTAAETAAPPTRDPGSISSVVAQVPKRAAVDPDPQWAKDWKDSLDQMEASEPVPQLVKGPPGKPPLMEGATKAEVLQAWGPPLEVLPEGTVEREDPFDPDEPVKVRRRLEGWSYLDQDDLETTFGWFDGEFLKALPFEDAHQDRIDRLRVFIDRAMEVRRGMEESNKAVLDGLMEQAPDVPGGETYNTPEAKEIIRRTLEQMENYRKAPAR